MTIDENEYFRREYVKLRRIPPLKMNHFRRKYVKFNRTPYSKTHHFQRKYLKLRRTPFLKMNNSACESGGSSGPVGGSPWVVKTRNLINAEFDVMNGRLVGCLIITPFPQTHNTPPRRIVNFEADSPGVADRSSQSSLPRGVAKMSAQRSRASPFAGL